MKKLIIFKFNIDGDSIRTVRATIEAHIKGAAKISTIPGFTVISFETLSCIDAVTHDLMLANWKFMVFDMASARGSFPAFLENMFLQFPELQPFMREKSKSLDETPETRFQWTAKGIADPKERISQLKARISSMQDELKGHESNDEFEKAIKVRDYIKLLQATISEIQPIAQK